PAVSRSPSCWPGCRRTAPPAAGVVAGARTEARPGPAGHRVKVAPTVRYRLEQDRNETLIDVSEVVYVGIPSGLRPARLKVGIVSAGRVGTALGVALERADHVVVACSAISNT